MEVSTRHRMQGPIEDTPQTSDDNPPDPISIDDIFKYYDFEPSSLNEEIQNILREHKKQRIQGLINRLNRALPDISPHLPDFSPLEYFIAFDIAGDADNTIEQATDPDFIKRVKFEAKEKKSLLDPKVRKQKLKQLENEREKELNQEEQSESEDEISDDDDDDSEPNSKRHTKAQRLSRKSSSNKPDSDLIITHSKHIVRDKSEKVDLPRPSNVDSKVWKKWSTIHQASYLAGIKNPNTYFYRNVAPGEKQKNGPWSAEEKELFMKRLEEMRNNGETKSQWGIFSQSIPGRVGYQCANFYRKLVIEHEIEDPSYFLDEQGILRHKKQQHNDTHEPKKRRKANDEPHLSRYDLWAQKNPIEHALDDLTNTEMKVPAISEDGYVLDYNTWLNIINKPNSINPFTQTHITKRQITVLTTDNFEEYRDKIKNLHYE